ncbi:MAG: S41 family peptidase [Porphyromonas sp.]|nr:S41 family peptidase [Porphyromonas sp.]
MKKLSCFLGLMASLFLLPQCFKHQEPQEYTASRSENFYRLWKVLDEGYCFFPERYPDPNGWKAVYDELSPLVHEQMSDDELFDLMSAMANRLKDGHVNIFSPFDVSRYRDWANSSQSFYNGAIRSLYLGDRYRQAGSLLYCVLQYNHHATDSIGYVVCNSFSSAITLQHWSAVFQRMAHCKGLIIDLRNNGGGLVSNASTMASCFISQRTLVAYLSAKQGPEHNSFGPLSAIFVDPAPEKVRWKKPVVLLTNRGVYSAANSVTTYMKQVPQVYIVGDTTGGGGGLPISSELPNGWWLRYSGSRTYDAHKKLIEWGVAPHFIQPQTEQATAQNQDALIEKAIEHIKQVGISISFGN